MRSWHHWFLHGAGCELGWISLASERSSISGTQARKQWTEFGWWVFCVFFFLACMVLVLTCCCRKFKKCKRILSKTTHTHYLITAANSSPILLHLYLTLLPFPPLDCFEENPDISFHCKYFITDLYNLGTPLHNPF